MAANVLKTDNSFLSRSHALPAARVRLRLETRQLDFLRRLPALLALLGDYIGEYAATHEELRRQAHVAGLYGLGQVVEGAVGDVLVKISLVAESPDSYQVARRVRRRGAARPGGVAFRCCGGGRPAQPGASAALALEPAGVARPDPAGHQPGGAAWPDAYPGKPGHRDFPVRTGGGGLLVLAARE